MRLTHVCPSAFFLSQGADGTGRGAAKLAQLKSNSNFVRNQLRAMGCEVLGDEDSPVRDAHHAHSCTRAVIIDASISSPAHLTRLFASCSGDAHYAVQPGQDPRLLARGTHPHT
jgi:hypothetical protein